jgi:hypothetical protein
MFWYYVTPYRGTKWAVLVESKHPLRSFNSKTEAMQAAVSAAENNYHKHGIASGIQVRDEAGQLRILAGATMGPYSLESPLVHTALRSITVPS